jgi:hypothetical protein
LTAHIKRILSKNATTDNFVIASDTTSTGIAKLIHTHAEELCAVSTVSSRTDGTYTASIEHSPDGSTWFNLASGSAQSANGSVAITVAKTVSVFPYIRASIVSTSVTSGATVSLVLYHGVQR